MTVDEIQTACNLLDTHYRYVKQGVGGENEKTYYEGMKTIIEYILMPSDVYLRRDDDGTHFVEVD